MSLSPRGRTLLNWGATAWRPDVVAELERDTNKLVDIAVAAGMAEAALSAGSSATGIGRCELDEIESRMREAAAPQKTRPVP